MSRHLYRGGGSALLASVEDDRLGHAWELALSGLRRGEIAGLRWVDVDLGAKTLSVVNNRVMAGSRSVETTRGRRHPDEYCHCLIASCPCFDRPRHVNRRKDWPLGRVRTSML